MNAMLVQTRAVVSASARLKMAAIDRSIHTRYVLGDRVEGEQRMSRLLASLPGSLKPRYRCLGESPPVHESELLGSVLFRWEYLKKQEQTGRPLSPHLSIYKPQLTWYASGFHRISGCVMAGS